ncbi:P-II family nitrogen regulator [Bacillus sp. FJAT-45350]|uniref:P-II family nitrogen regulator n=1 Tax=Bacillus sp. FJAT-45350 TaxID=2011014 RepID=UPI000BB6C9E5|nr:P-II family nitrogen regulator [Bacillus sp. FJAT-45350]
MGISKNAKLVVTVIAKEKTDKILEAIENEGVTKSTIILSRGKSENNPTLFLGITIEPQREVIYTLVPKEKADKIFNVITEAGDLNKPLQGLVFILDVEKVGGIDLSMFKETN